MRRLIASTLLLCTILACSKSPDNPTPDPDPTPEPVTQPKLLDIQSRTAVVDAYKAVMAQKVAVADMQWTGNYSNCQPGVPGEAFKKYQMARYQFIRDMIGLGSVSVSDSLSQMSQKVALAMASSNTTNGFKWDTLACGKNLVFPTNTTNVFCGYDPVYNKYTDPFGLWASGFDATVQSRRIIFNPKVTKIGFGEVPNEKIKTTFGVSAVTYGTKWNAGREFVAWPVAGWNIFAPSNWSFAVERADFKNATVSVTADGKPMDITVNYRSNATEDNTIVWKVGILDLNQDHEYEVTISKVLVNGTSKDFKYKVKTINYNEVAFL